MLAQDCQIFLYFEKRKENGREISRPLMSLPVNRNADAHANILAVSDSATAIIFIESAQIYLTEMRAALPLAENVGLILANDRYIYL